MVFKYLTIGGALLNWFAGYDGLVSFFGRQDGMWMRSGWSGHMLLVGCGSCHCLLSQRLLLICNEWVKEHRSLGCCRAEMELLCLVLSPVPWYFITVFF